MLEQNIQNSHKSLKYKPLNDSNDSLLFEKRIWDVEDVAKFMNVSKGHIYNLKHADEIPFKQKGKRGKLYFLPEEIFEWIDGGLK